MKYRCERSNSHHDADYQRKEWSKEVSKEQYLSYVALVVLLPYRYVLIGP